MVATTTITTTTTTTTTSTTNNKNRPLAHLAASFIAAIVNFPLWKASAIAQSGFSRGKGSWFNVYTSSMNPPYKGIPAVVLGMTWARFAIFWGSDTASSILRGLRTSENEAINSNSNSNSSSNRYLIGFCVI